MPTRGHDATSPSASGCPSLLQPMQGPHVQGPEPVVDWPHGSPAVGVPEPSPEPRNGVPGAGASELAEEPIVLLVASRAAHLVDATVQHLRTCLEEVPAGQPASDQLHAIIESLMEARSRIEELSLRPDDDR